MKCTSHYHYFSIGMDPLHLHHITSACVHILNCIQLAEHWGGILCKFLITSVHDWIHSVNSQNPACIHTHTHHIDLKCAFVCVCVWIRVLTHTFMLCLLTMSVSAQTSGIKTVKLPKLTSMRQSCSAFHLDLKEGKNNSFVPILNLRVSFRS